MITRLTLAAGLAGLLACHPTHGTPGVATTTYLQEVEVNDHAWSANWVGDLHVGERLVIDGHITECCPDPFDGFALHATGPMTLRLTLHALDPLADLDLALHLPLTGELLAAFETPAHPEIGSIDLLAPCELHAVVRAFRGSSSYRLEIEALPLVLGLASEPGVGPHASEAFRPYGSLPGHPDR